MEFPTYEQMAKNVAEKALDEILYDGKSIREWIKIIGEQELKTGHWIAIDEEPHEDYECDKCGYTISTYTANIEPHTEFKYCPNCGAKMESEVKHDSKTVNK